MPITYVEEGKTVQIQKITGKDKLRSHLANMGFVEKGNISCGQYDLRGKRNKSSD